METTTVEGTNSTHKVLLFALSTCGWCRRTRQFLEEKGVAYDYIYVDLLTGDPRREVLAELKKWTTRRAFPTIVIDEDEVQTGLDKEKLEKALEL
jgi:glutaredoxin-like protein NrdH